MIIPYKREQRILHNYRVTGDLARGDEVLNGCRLPRALEMKHAQPRQHFHDHFPSDLFQRKGDLRPQSSGHTQLFHGSERAEKVQSIDRVHVVLPINS